MARKPLIAGNWKMNLNHLEAISTVQKLAFALPKEYYEKVDVAVTEMLSKLGVTWVVVGHSERREYHGETDALVAAKAAIALAHNLHPIVCVGEPLEIREAGTHVDYVVEQTRNSLAGLSADDLRNTVIAYEPVWAIGTGKVASAADAQEVCHAIRQLLVELAGADVADTVRILYGGSVKTETVAEIVGQPDVDGGLVGGASLNGEEFAKLAANAAGGPF